MKKSLIAIVVVIGIILLIVMTLSGRYNKLVTLEEGVTAAWSQVENVYQRRADLIPNLVNTVKGYADFEQNTLTAVIEARAKATNTTIDAGNLTEANLQQFQQAQQGLGSALSRLMVVVEKYPDLKANQNFMDLQSQLEGTENRITVERRAFNETAQAYNTTIRRFPNNIIAGLFGFEKKAYFQSEAGAEKAPEVQF
ncbi:MAG: LemA family protein [Lentimicrobium sp.]|jgi:LemA protein|nr:LemA family protein [Lentimicrobium sp.]